MNIFILDENIEKSAQAHNDRHIIKMPLEMAQMLSTNLYVLNGITSKAQSFREEEKLKVIFKDFPKKSSASERFRDYYMMYNPNHPCTMWLRESEENTRYGIHLMYHMLNEYKYRYNKQGILYDICLWMNDNYNFELFQNKELTPFAQALPVELQNENAVVAYRNYYMRDKRHLAKWSKRGVPEWWI